MKKILLFSILALAVASMYLAPLAVTWKAHCPNSDWPFTVMIASIGVYNAAFLAFADSERPSLIGYVFGLLATGILVGLAPLALTFLLTFVKPEMFCFKDGLRVAFLVVPLLVTGIPTLLNVRNKND